MNPALIIIGVPVGAVFAGSAIVFARERTVRSLLQLAGAGFLVMVVFAHVAEEFHLFPRMGWGLPDSPGHYVDLVSATAGPILFSTGYVSRRLARRRISNTPPI